mmetsp:Transcript_23594/g.60317  ORF Transcript_23594/g.60317 Transcript_23594/m.60317 type:complete len:325 (+) Transcript_23594:198-1172(+)
MRHPCVAPDRAAAAPLLHRPTARVRHQPALLRAPPRRLRRPRHPLARDARPRGGGGRRARQSGHQACQPLLRHQVRAVLHELPAAADGARLHRPRPLARRPLREHRRAALVLSLYGIRALSVVGGRVPVARPGHQLPEGHVGVAGGGRAVADPLAPPRLRRHRPHPHRPRLHLRPLLRPAGAAALALRGRDLARQAAGQGRGRRVPVHRARGVGHPARLLHVRRRRVQRGLPPPLQHRAPTLLAARRPRGAVPRARNVRPPRLLHLGAHEVRAAAARPARVQVRGARPAAVRHHARRHPHTRQPRPRLRPPLVRHERRVRHTRR